MGGLEINPGKQALLKLLFSLTHYQGQPVDLDDAGQSPFDHHCRTVLHHEGQHWHHPHQQAPVCLAGGRAAAGLAWVLSMVFAYQASSMKVMTNFRTSGDWSDWKLTTS